MVSKKATKKLKKGKKLESTKPLLNFTKIGHEYKPQSPTE
jgi:hypothetical protein